MMKGYCIHFAGTIRDNCDFGHNLLQLSRPQTQKEIDWHNDNYPDLPLERSGIAKRMPCAVRNKVRCSDYREPTQEDIDRQEQEIDMLLQQINSTREAIVKYIDSVGQKGLNFMGKIPCPVCNIGTIQFSYAGNYNGHIHARCNIPGCVQWME